MIRWWRFFNESLRIITNSLHLILNLHSGILGFWIVLHVLGVSLGFDLNRMERENGRCLWCGVWLMGSPSDTCDEMETIYRTTVIFEPMAMRHLSLDLSDSALDLLDLRTFLQNKKTEGLICKWRKGLKNAIIKTWGLKCKKLIKLVLTK